MGGREVILADFEPSFSLPNQSSRLYRQDYMKRRHWPVNSCEIILFKAQNWPGLFTVASMQSGKNFVTSIQIISAAS